MNAESAVVERTYAHARVNCKVNGMALCWIFSVTEEVDTQCLRRSELKPRYLGEPKTAAAVPRIFVAGEQQQNQGSLFRPAGRERAGGVSGGSKPNKPQKKEPKKRNVN